MKIISGITFLVVCLLTATAFGQQLSSHARVFLHTYDPGEELYAAFGHTAIRIQDSARHIDRSYNYGTFDFSTPGFYPKFLKGKLNYMLSVYPTGLALRSIERENRTVYEQELYMSPDDIQLVFDFLENNALPENRFYLYDFFFDNCASRVRDVFTASLKAELVFHVQDEGLTFRKMIHPYLAEKKWAKLGIDLLLGQLADRKATPAEYMFLPDYLSAAFASATLITDSGAQPFSGQKVVIFTAQPFKKSLLSWLSPLNVFIFIGLISILLSWVTLRKGTLFRGFDFFIFFLTGLVGMLVFLGWFATDHTVLVKNWNLLWAWPLHLVAAFLLFRRSRPAWLRAYFGLAALFAILIIVFGFLLPQWISPWLIPFQMALALRGILVFSPKKS